MAVLYTVPVLVLVGWSLRAGWINRLAISLAVARFVEGRPEPVAPSPLPHPRVLTSQEGRALYRSALEEHEARRNP